MLSQGRLDLGVGTGWQREEYDAEGLDFDAARPAADRHARRVQGAVARHAGRDRHADVLVPRHLLRTEAGAGRRRAAVDRRDAAPAQPRSARALRRRVDPDHGRDRRRHRGRRASGSRDAWTAAGRDPAGSRCRRRCGSHAATTAGPTSRAAWSRCRSWSRRAPPTSTCRSAAFCRDPADAPAVLAEIVRVRDAAFRRDASHVAFGRRAHAVRRLSDPPDARCRSRTRPAVIRTTTTGSGSTATPTTSTSRSAWPCTRTAGIIDGAFSIVHDGVQRSVFASGRIPADRDADADRSAVDRDRRAAARHARARRRRRSRHRRRRHVHGAHGRARRTAPDDDDRHAADDGLDPPDAVGHVVGRDHDRRRRRSTIDARVRHQGPVVGRAPGRRAAPAPRPTCTLPQIFFLWAPINFDDCCTHFLCFERGERRSLRRQPGACST